MFETSFVEYTLQFILFISVIFCTTPISFTNDSSKLNKIPDIHGGLENIKALLYEDSNLFLIISTLVLLVALIGAAIMTRNKKAKK